MPQKEVYTAIGLMSGTSLDGVDAALIETDGLRYVRPLGFLTLPYDATSRKTVRAAFGKKRREDPLVRTAEEEVTNWHVRAVKALLEETGKTPDLIGFHGQTIYHAPQEKRTIQIGDGAELAKECGADVIADFRRADVEAGGEGAPLAPLYHLARVNADCVKTPCVILNIGGVANVTYIGESEEDLLAFDCGPGNALMDDWTQQKTGQLFDEDGLLAKRGKVDHARVKSWMDADYFSRSPPKSLDRDEWDIAALGRLTQDMSEMSAEDGAATLMAFTIFGIIKALDHLPQKPLAFYACGGGRRNLALMEVLGSALKEQGVELDVVDTLGWDGDALEAECFAYLAVRSKLGLPLSMPGTTGIAKPMSGGTLFKRR